MIVIPQITKPEFTKDVPLTVLETNDETGYVKSYGSVFGVIDEQGEIVDNGAFAKAIERRKIKRIWQHDYKMPVGKLLSISEDAKGLLLETQYNLKTDWGRNAYYAVKHGDVDSYSIGYNEVKAKNYVDDEGAKHLGEVDLREVSDVTFPSNEYATAVEIKSMADDELELKTIIPYSKTPLAPEGQAWDGPGQVAAADVTDLKVMCACIVGDPANKTSYKLPHHMASGGHSCVWAGVRAAYAATQGARGGVQGCGGAESHLLKHYDDFGKDRPGASSIEPDETKAGRVLSGVNQDDITALRASLVDGVKLCDAVLGRAAPVAPPGKSEMFNVESIELNKRLQKLNEQLIGLL